MESPASPHGLHILRVLGRNVDKMVPGGWAAHPFGWRSDTNIQNNMSAMRSESFGVGTFFVRRWD